MDTHPVNGDAVGKFTGLIVSTERSTLHVLLQWIVRRLVLSNSKTYYQSMPVTGLVEKEISEEGLEPLLYFYLVSTSSQTICTNFSSFCDICKKKS